MKNDGRRKGDLRFLQHGPRYVWILHKANQSTSAHVQPNARNSSRVQMSRCASSIQIFGRPHSVADRTLWRFLIRHSPGSTRIAYRWIVVVMPSRWYSCGVGRSEWGRPKASVVMMNEAAARCGSWYERVNHPLEMVLHKEQRHPNHGRLPVTC